MRNDVYDKRIEPAQLLAFPGAPDGLLDDVGGKGLALIQLAAQGQAVPPGVVLTSHFFAPWIVQVVASDAWRALLSAPEQARAALCATLKEHAAGLALSDLQCQSMAALRSLLAQQGGSGLFAVRSSSPQEDLHGASFAGGYDTCLGVGPDGLLGAVRSCFVSLFDERVVAYKVARAIALDAPSMAVVVQRQIASEVAGVAFSLNPLNNDYDEAVIDANWGLGDTVVAGEVTPDHWVLDKLAGTTLEQCIGAKQLSRWVRPEGGLTDRADARRTQPCLSADQLKRLLDVLLSVEAAFGHPVDIEWAIAADTIYLLQARPVTTFVPLPAQLTTAPGQRRRLYMDTALSSGLTINAPISPMGLDVFRRLFAELAQLALGRHRFELGPDDAMMVFDGGRMYLDFSNMLWVTSPRKMAKSMEMGDVTMARALEHVDAKRYKSERRPRWARARHLLLLPGVLWRMRRFVFNSVLPFIAPQRGYLKLKRQLDAFEPTLNEDGALDLPFDQYWERYVGARLQTLLDVSLAALGPCVGAVQAFGQLARGVAAGDDELLRRIACGFEGNVVVEMSIEMHRLAVQLDPADRSDPQGLAQRLTSQVLMPTSLTAQWQGFLLRFGCRGPMEMDLAHPRYADAPLIALKQVAAMATDDAQRDPGAAARRQVALRRAAVATVIERAGPLRRAVLRQLDLLVERFGGLRDTPKQHVLMILHGLRRRIVAEGAALHRLGRLDAPEHVFDFDMQELRLAASDPEVDLRAIRAKRRGYYDVLRAQVSNFPSLIDSRGRILRPPPGICRPGEFAGIGLAPGVVRGPARTLRSPHDKPLLKGDVLIAYTTDPGWTPLFVNAAAVVLEIGGVLQHGAVVARELGLPCVAGIVGITSAIEDGQLVEVDGAAGIVRLVMVVQK